jgi:hypothetical protein
MKSNLEGGSNSLPANTSDNSINALTNKIGYDPGLARVPQIGKEIGE